MHYNKNSVNKGFMASYRIPDAIRNLICTANVFKLAYSAIIHGSRAFSTQASDPLPWFKIPFRFPATFFTCKQRITKKRSTK